MSTTTSRSRRPGRRFWIIAVGSVAAWLAVDRLLVPALIRSAYRGESLGFLNRIITGQATHPVEFYLDAWSSISFPLTALLVGSIAVAYLGVVFDMWGRLRRWQARFAEREAALGPDSGAPGPAWYLWIVVWCGLLAGWWEAAYVLGRMALGQWLPGGPATTTHVAWMAPLSYGAAFLVLGLPVWAAARLRPRRISLKWVLFGAGFLCLFSMFRSTAGRLELYGAIPLAAGLSWLGARLAAVYWRGFSRVVGLSLPVMLLVIAGSGIGLTLGERAAARRTLAGLPEADPDAPNVLLIILDTVRSKSLSLYGYERPTTPSLERLAERGVVFDRAVASSPWTLPTHATVFTGRHAHELSVGFRTGLDDTHPTLAERLRDRGYHTAGFVANLFYCGPQFGLDRGFIRYSHWPITPAGIAESSWLVRSLWSRARRMAGSHRRGVRKTAADINEEFLRWRSGAAGSRPYFAFLNYFDAHSPYRPPGDHLLRFADEPPRYWLQGSEYSDRDLRELTAAYDASIAYLDARLGELFDELRARGDLENTLVIVTSDHGEQFGEHGLMYHSNSLYMPLLHVPLLISFPSVLPSGVRVPEPVGVGDIGATVADLIGLPDSSFPGRSFASSWRPGAEAGAAGEPRPLLSEVSRNRRISDNEPTILGDMQSLVAGRLHYIRRGDGHEELYDWFADPDETTDLASSAGGRARLPVFRGWLEGMLERAERASRVAIAPAP